MKTESSDQYDQMAAKLAELDSRIAALEQKAYEQSIYASATDFPQIIGGLGDAVKAQYKT